MEDHGTGKKKKKKQAIFHSSKQVAPLLAGATLI